MKYIIEIATSDFLTTQSAVEGGADRIELCANLAEGGTTPSYGHIRKCREAFDVLIYPIIRPRGGDFLFTDEEFDIMLQDVKLCKQLGCDGVVIGLLNRDGSIDKKRSSQLVEAAYPLGVTFHRAFDRCRDVEHRQFVDPFAVVPIGQLGGIARITEIQKIYALHDTSVADVETRDQTFREHVTDRL